MTDLTGMYHVTDPGTTTSTTSSTLIETVSLDYENFSDNFLTCGTCLCVYDSVEHKPKILPCSHTVCHTCLERILANQGADTTNFRCPICREIITVPRGGVQALPPSFIVNQLLDLMSHQRRDVVPKCSTHSQSELMFCESCDSVFCMECTGGAHTNKGASGHTVIPFSVAIRRVSEILLYKAGLCIRNLDKASGVVAAEMARLDQTAEQCLEAAGRAFEDMQALVHRRKQEVAEMVCNIRDDKMRLLREQLEIIDQEKLKVRSDCAGLQQQVEVRNITAKIGDLNEKLDMSTTLIEPRENAFMMFDVERRGGTATTTGGALAIESNGRADFDRGSTARRAQRTGQGSSVIEELEREADSRVDFVQTSIAMDYNGSNRAQGTGEVFLVNDHHPLLTGGVVERPPPRNESTSHASGSVGMSLIGRVLARFGCVRISKTFPALCTATIENTPTVHLKSTVVVRTVDYHGNPRTTGGDPVCADVKSDRRGGEKIHVTVGDKDDGTYVITFKTSTPGRHVLNITIFERCIRDAPFPLDVCAHINPSAVIGRGTGSGELQFRQPVGVAVDRLTGNILVLDTGNSRIQVLDKAGRFLRSILGDSLEQRSGTGFVLTPRGTLVVANWRTKRITELSMSTGETIRTIVCDAFVEPICVTANQHGDIIVGDNGLGQLLVFDSNGLKTGSIGRRGDKPGQFQLISNLYSAPNDDILVCDHRVQAFSRAGALLYEFPTSRTRGQYGGVTVDSCGNYLLTRSEKGRCIVEVYSPSRVLMFEIDSWADKLKRPSGLATSDDGFVYVVDLGNDCVKKFRYI